MGCRLDFILLMLNLLVVMLSWLYRKPLFLGRHAKLLEIKCHKVNNFHSNDSLKMLGESVEIKHEPANSAKCQSR